MNPELTPLFFTRNAGNPLILGSTSSAMRRSAIEAISATARAPADQPRRPRARRENCRPTQTLPSSGNTSGLSVTAFASRTSVVAAAAHHIEACAHDLRLTAHRVGILNAFAIQMRGANAAAGEQAAQHRSHVHLPGLTAQRLNARIEWRIAALHGIDRHRAARERRGEHVLNLHKPRKRKRG